VLVFGVSTSPVTLLVPLLVETVVMEFGEANPEVFLEGTTTCTIDRLDDALSELRTDFDLRKLERLEGAIINRVSR